MKKITAVFLLVSCLLFTNSSNAYAFTNISDTISTSRPSAVATISSAVSAGATEAVITDVGALFVAGDVVALSGNGEVATIKSYSPIDTPETGKRTLYFTNPLANNYAAGATITYISKATHVIKFTPAQAIPNGGKIVLTFPVASSSATPSSAGFGFNGLAAGDIQSTNVGCAFAISSPTITCTTTNQVSVGTPITLLIGCLAELNSFCQTPKETLVNPTKVKSEGTADIWKPTIKTTTTTDAIIESKTLNIASIESVSLKAQVSLNLALSNTGLDSGVLANTGNPGCKNTERISSVSNSTATSVNLGKLALTPSTPDVQIGNMSAQLINVTTNTYSGYVLTATASGHLANESGFGIPDSLTPGTFQSGAPFFGIHACGTDANLATWTTENDNNCKTAIATSTGSLCKYGFPDPTNSLTIAENANGPIGPDIATGSGAVSILYAAGIHPDTPTGIYHTKVTYMITTSF